jgi:rhamnulokinase
VVAGPIEATAAGNLLVQAIGAGEVSGIDEAREIVRQSFQIAEFQPKPESR